MKDNPAPVPVGYRRKRDKTKIARIIAELDVDLVKRVDCWGIFVGMPTRTAAIRHLIDAGLKTETAPGNSLQATSPDASEQ